MQRVPRPKASPAGAEQRKSNPAPTRTNSKSSKATTRNDASTSARARRNVERVQTGVRLERRILSVLKAIADLHGLSLGDLLEGIVLHAFEGKTPFGAASLEKIATLRDVFELDLRAEDSHTLVEPHAGHDEGGKRGRAAAGEASNAARRFTP